MHINKDIRIREEQLLKSLSTVQKLGDIKCYYVVDVCMYGLILNLVLDLNYVSNIFKYRIAFIRFVNRNYWR